MPEILPAEIDRRRRTFRPGEHAGDRGAGIEDHGQQVGAVLVLYPGLGCGDADALDVRHVGIFLRRERRNRG
jgi:hypothetical protein